MKKGQMTIYGLIFTFVALVLLAALTPAIYVMVNSISGNATSAPATPDTATSTIIKLVPTFLALSVLLIGVIYTLAGGGRRQEEY